ncbi:uncharacterized protein LOC136089534 [Hydra vulgaris]|uniref:Uncharacterized protein LOC136089534 n=1 Tax=Hydra vulgaris TaxID=6087 RepID=A0ABM4DBA8_HYDVU
MSALSVIRLKVNGMVATALVDTGCSKTILNKKFLPKSQCRYSNSQKVVTFEGKVHQCTGSAVVILEVDGIKARDEVILVDFQPFGVNMMLGMSSIKLLGGVSISPLGKAKKKKDHEAVFNGVEWRVKWKWRDGESPDRLRNKVAQYGIPQHARADYENELQDWIDRKWLLEYDENELGPPKGQIPLMAVIQRNKDLFRTVLDWREANDFIETYTRDADVCVENLREWRRKGNKPAIIDLRKAYLQLKTDKSLWPFQAVVFRNKRYCLTRLGFGLNVAPMIMKSVVSAVIDQDELVKSGTSAYVDDIFVDESVVSLDYVKRHFFKYGLESKEGEQIGNDGVRVLGLCVRKVGNKLMWSRGNRVDAISEKLTRRVVFSICGQLSTCGDWAVCGDERKVWVDASSLAMGALIQVGETTVEDATWLRKETSDIHINMAELDAVIR